jgi:hypothetical protein
MGSRTFRLNLSEPPVLSAKYEVESAGRTYDAFALAEACMSEWRAYLKRKGLL